VRHVRLGQQGGCVMSPDWDLGPDRKNRGGMQWVNGNGTDTARALQHIFLG
jgi:hypothetical protein